MTSLGLGYPGFGQTDHAPTAAAPWVVAHTHAGGAKIDSIACPNSLAILNANGRLGSDLPVSIALTVCRDTPSRSARSACDQPRSPRSSRTWLLIDHPVVHMCGCRTVRARGNYSSCRPLRRLSATAQESADRLVAASVAPHVRRSNRRRCQLCHGQTTTASPQRDRRGCSGRTKCMHDRTHVRDMTVKYA